ncbi:hypothetical protein C0Q70_06036 [Pomacea canaliculata]|uniref:dCMP deaminase n=1 Tax=Pomacea canaliculata TaxID=400727 RepID=A0A2T7PMW2_POMCA|nr:hypothetical protein C0Q70_06036 [Pomacea canaliculata]
MDSDIQAKDKDVPDERDSTMRSDYLSWKDYFMGIALLAAQRSKDPRTQVGACIVSEDKKIVGIGYNGMPENINDEEAPWAVKKRDPMHLRRRRRRRKKKKKKDGRRKEEERRKKEEKEERRKKKEERKKKKKEEEGRSPGQRYKMGGEQVNSEKCQGEVPIEKRF